MRWMKHLAMAHSDQAIAFLLEEHGAEGYGVWWLILEDISAPMEPGKMEPIASHSVVKWSQICHCSVRRFRSIVGSLAEKNLIYVESDIDRIQIYIPNILKYKDEYSKKSGETPEQEQIQKQRENRERTDEAVSVGAVDEVATWYTSEFYPIFPLHKAGKQGLQAARVHLRTAELRGRALTALKSQLPELSSREPSKRPYPATWINGHRWEDEHSGGMVRAPTLFPVKLSFADSVEKVMRENGSEGLPLL